MCMAVVTHSFRVGWVTDKAEGGDCGKLENKVGLIKERQHVLSRSRLWPCRNVGLVLPVFQFSRKVKSGFLCEIFSVSALGTFVFVSCFVHCFFLSALAHTACLPFQT